MPNPAIFLCMVEIISLPGVWENWTQHPGKILPDWEPEQSLLLGPSTFSLPPANIIHSAFTWAPTTKVGKRYEDLTLKPIRSALGGLCWQTWALSSTKGSSQHPLLLQFHLHLFYRLKGGAQRHPSRVQQLLKQPLLPDSEFRGPSCWQAALSWQGWTSWVTTIAKSPELWQLQTFSTRTSRKGRGKLVVKGINQREIFGTSLSTGKDSSTFTVEE